MIRSRATNFQAFLVIRKEWLIQQAMKGKNDKENPQISRTRKNKDLVINEKERKRLSKP